MRKQEAVGASPPQSQITSCVCFVLTLGENHGWLSRVLWPPRTLRSWHLVPKLCYSLILMNTI